VSARRPVCNPFKLTALIDSPALLRSAAEIMIQDQVEGSCADDRRRIAEMSPAASRCEDCRQSAGKRRGVDGGRLIFADRMASLSEHLARLRAADLFLDTLPYNAHATTLDSLWAGVPLLTCPGESFASRVAASLLRTAGLPELIAGSPLEYEEKALELAADPVRLGHLRHKLAQRETSLFDTERYTRNIEGVYEAIYERHHSGSPPDHINEHLAT
jgi:protein O-GlcNAc transferase